MQSKHPQSATYRKDTADIRRPSSSISLSSSVTLQRRVHSINGGVVASNSKYKSSEPFRASNHSQQKSHVSRIGSSNQLNSHIVTHIMGESLSSKRSSYKRADVDISKKVVEEFESILAIKNPTDRDLRESQRKLRRLVLNEGIPEDYDEVR